MMLRKIFKGLFSYLPSGHSYRQPGQTDADSIIDAIDIPQELLDPLTYAPLRDPVVTPSGHCYSRDVIQEQLRIRPIDPLAGEQPLALDQLRPAPAEITGILKQFADLRRTTRMEVMAVFSESASVEIILERYQECLTDLGKQMAEILQKLVIQGTIQQIKNRLKIDTRNPSHIAYWSAKAAWGSGVPYQVDAMMRAAAVRYDRVEDFVAAIDRARQLSWSGRFFNYWFSDAQTNNLRYAGNLRSYSVC